MYQRYFGLKEKPFKITPDPRFLYLSEKHAEALDHLTYGISQGEGFMVISGDVGTGKTTIIRSLLERLDDARIKTAIILNPLLQIEDLLKSILEDFGLSAKGNSKKELIDQLNLFLLSLNREGRKAVVIIDESQNLAPDLLEELRSLSNLETDQEKLLQIVLVGQLELLNMLNRPNLRQLKQRISVNYRLDPLSLKEMKEYISHRLSVAGFQGELAFSTRALRQVFKVSRGIPRLINLLCDRILLVLYLEQKMRVTPVHVRKAIESLSGGKSSYSIFKAIFSRRLAFGGGIVGLIIFLGALSLIWLSPRNSSTPEAIKLPGEIPNIQSSVSPFLYSVHLSSFKKKALADRAIEKICQEGLEAFGIVVQLPATGIWYRILVGQYQTRDEAQSLANRLRENGSFPYSTVISIPQGDIKIKQEIKGSRL
ncbi:MAG: AAA family ATPase [Deltaproteobacteria bacterium]|nr:AAA family ATPase [Deltaproteobacteria bacterium]